MRWTLLQVRDGVPEGKRYHQSSAQAAASGKTSIGMCQTGIFLELTLTVDLHLKPDNNLVRANSDLEDQCFRI
jgi:hypothetical protein